MYRRRGKTFSARGYVPVDLQPYLNGRTELVKSTGATDSRQAILLAAQWQQRLLSLFKRLRKDGPVMTPPEIDALVARYLAVQLDAAELGLVAKGQTVDDLEAAEWRLQDQLEAAEVDQRFNRFGDVRTVALALLGGATVDEDSDGFRVLCRRLLDAKVAALWAELGARQGQPLRSPQSIPQAIASAPNVAPTVAPTPPLSVAFQTFNDTEGTRKHWRPKTLGDHRSVQGILLDFLGDVPVGSVSKDDLRRFYAMIRLIPAKRGPELKGMTIPAIVEATKADDRPRLADKSINARYLSTMKAFFNYAEKVDWVTKSPAVVLEPMKLSKAGTDSKGFSSDELVKIFSGLRAVATAIDREGYYWVAVLALHAGARLDEIAGLQLADVRQTEGIWCMHIRSDAGGRLLKNEYSVRIVPIHSRVIELGFLDYLNAQEGQRLVDSLRGNKVGKFGGPVSLVFNKHLADIGVKTSRNQNFHSLRHTWATSARRAGIPDADADELGGWSKSGSQRARTYAADHTIPAKAALIERLKFI